MWPAFLLPVETSTKIIHDITQTSRSDTVTRYSTSSMLMLSFLFQVIFVGAISAAQTGKISLAAHMSVYVRMPVCVLNIECKVHNQDHKQFLTTDYEDRTQTAMS